MADTFLEDSDYQEANEAFEKGRFADALALLTKVAERYPDELEVKKLLALCSFERAMQRLESDTSTSDDWRTVIENLGSVAKSDDDEKIGGSLAVAYHNLGVCLNQQEAYEEAQEQFQRALDLDPELTDTSISLAINYADQGNLEKAEELLQAVIEHAPGSLEARHALGLILSSQGKESEAVEQFKRAQSPERDNLTVHYSRGVSLAHQGEFEEAEAAFRQALELHPEFVPALYNLGLILREKGNHSGAEQCFAEVARLDPDNPGGHFCLANLYERRDLNLAISSWEKYLEVASKIPSEAEMVEKVTRHVANLKRKS
jgi:tetratricopeptide (TPR) repeat protein